MSFKHIASAVEIGNRALGMVAEGKTISSFDDPGKNAQVLSRWYKPVVALLLEMHHWGLATKQSELTKLTNTRDNQWLNAYAAPTDMAFPVGFAGLGGSNTTYYRGLAGLLGVVQGKPMFQFHSNVLYSNYEGTLEYVSYDITEADFNATFTDIVVIRLAAKCALEIPKDFELSQELENSAATKINMAMAANMNAGNHKYGNQISESEMVRGTGFGHSWDYVPLGPST